MNKTVEVLPDKDALIDRAAQVVVERIKAAIAQRGMCTIALAGGNTPRPLYEQLAKETLPWRSLHIFWGDERYVPADHPDSNQGMARQVWLDHVPIPAPNIHPMPTEADDPLDAANQHESELQEMFQTAPGEFPSFDIILLGIGDDAHTASLFPHTQALQVRDRLITVGQKDGQPRITFTSTLINHARTIIFLVAGVSKRPALQAIFAAEEDDASYPARLIQPEGDIIWLLDQAAGQELLVSAGE